LPRLRMVGMLIGDGLDIPVIELLAQICINSLPDKSPPTARRQVVKRRLREMFAPALGQRASYAVEHLIVAAKAFGLVEESNGELAAIIRPRTTRHGPEEDE
jgi:hypothetical protein